MNEQDARPAAVCLPEGADFCDILTRKALPGITADIRRYGWERAYDGKFQPEYCYIDYALTHRSDRSMMIHDRQCIMPGSLVFIPQGKRYNTHCERSEHYSFCLSYDPGRVDAFGDDSSAILGNLEPCLDVRDAGIERSIHSIVEEIRHPGFASDLTIELACDAIIVGLARHFHQRRAQSDHQQSVMAPWRLRKLKDFINDGLDQTLSIAELARQCGISTRHLVRTFKNAEGMTLSCYIARERIERARVLLAQDQEPIKVIAAFCGFGSASSFHVAFANAIGVTPGQYRDSFRATSVGAATDRDGADLMAHRHNRGPT